jgi:plasmid maintenance system antidote protein VapI
MPNLQVERALREAILADPASFNELAKATGITRPTITAFVKDTRSMRLDLAAKLCEHYGLELTKRKG